MRAIFTVTRFEELAENGPVLSEAIVSHAEAVHEGNRESDIPPTRGVRLIVGMTHTVTFSGNDASARILEY